MTARRGFLKFSQYFGNFILGPVGIIVGFTQMRSIPNRVFAKKLPN